MTRETFERLKKMGITFDDDFENLLVKPLENQRVKLEAERLKTEPEIFSIEATQKPQIDKSIVAFNVKINVLNELGYNKLVVVLDAREFQAYRFVDLNASANYWADVYVDLSIPREEEVFKITANLINFTTNKITNTKSVNVKVNKSGEVGETDDEVEQLNKKNETKIQSCGIEFRNLIKCEDYIIKKKTLYGPFVFGNLKMKDYSNWDDLITSKKLTIEEKEIIIAMSENEGNLDAINAYDDQIVSIGAMQKTVDQNGYGELPIQIWEFGQEFPEKYKSLLLNCGWKVEEEEENNVAKYKIYYNGLSGLSLYNFIRKGFNKENVGKKVQCIALEPLICLIKDVDFQAKQIEDFADRMHQSLQKKPKGYSNKISDFIKSSLGKALVLDNDVNRPSQTKFCFGESLDIFFKENSKISKNPLDWQTNHSKYEIDILNIYGPLRGKGKFTMTNAKIRFNNLKSKLK
jgi:hypothetical protein